MDSLTQIVLGAAVGELTLGKKIGNKAQLFGAIAGTIPDLDILLNFAFPDNVSKILIHRSYSHAWLTHILLGIPLAYWCFRVYKKTIDFKSWYWLWLLGLTTHALLDAFTTYGTRLFLPFTDFQVGFNNISVIDPLYTLPFMFILGYCLFLKRDNPARLKWAWRSVYVSTAYMVMTFGVKYAVHQKVSSEMQRQQIPYEHLYTSPTFFNNALWASISTTDSVLTVGEYSVFQDQDSISFVSYPRHLELEKGFEGKGLTTLKWFSQGKYFYQLQNADTLNVYIVKWGRSDFSQTDPDKAFVFYYKISKQNPEQIIAYEPTFSGDLMKRALKQLWDRIWKA